MVYENKYIIFGYWTRTGGESPIKYLQYASPPSSYLPTSTIYDRLRRLLLRWVSCPWSIVVLLENTLWD